MKEVTFEVEHPGKLQVVAVVLADSPAYAEGLKKLHAELQGTPIKTELAFDEVQGILTVTVSAESAAHKAKVKADAAAVQKRLDEINPKARPAKKKAVKKKAKK